MQDKLHYFGACKASPVVWVCDDRVNLVAARLSLFYRPWSSFSSRRSVRRSWCSRDRRVLEAACVSLTQPED